MLLLQVPLELLEPLLWPAEVAASWAEMPQHLQASVPLMVLQLLQLGCCSLRPEVWLQWACLQECAR
jgi:hypothetical protein